MEIDLTKLAETLEKVTPGPWSAECHFGDDNFVVDEDDTPVCTLHSSGIQDVKANAALIALAPALAAHKLADAKRLEAAEKMAEALREIADLDGSRADEASVVASAALSAWDEAKGSGG